MADTNQFLTVTLPTRPSCKDCLSISDDDIAVAGGEFVHILTPKYMLPRPETAGHPYWYVNSLRVNLFRQDEWPEQTLASTRDMSIGEEQSNSFVAGLSWSKAGLGVHRRSILGLLTSNLILSLWETDSTQSNFQRTCVFDAHFDRHDPAHCDSSSANRRGRRVRCFAWLPVLEISSISKWGSHCIVVADDAGVICILQVSKLNPAALGHWKFDVKLRCHVEDLECVACDRQHMSPLQKRLNQQSPVTKISVGPWYQTTDTKQRDDRVSPAELFRADLTATKGATSYAATIHASVDSDTQQVVLTIRPDTRGLQPSMTCPDHTNLAQNITTNTREKLIRACKSPENSFQEAVQPLRDKFNRTYQLYGHLQTRFLGTNISTDNNTLVTCLTLHPTDMIEYTIPSTEKTYVLFKNIRTAEGSDSSTPRSTRSVQLDILRISRDVIKNGGNIKTKLDEILLYIVVKLATIVLDPTSEVRLFLEDTFGSGASETAGQEIDKGIVLSEPCGICGASIDFTTDTTQCGCSSGHLFSRCQLSFLAIQEPGISKYCSRCGRQFLNLIKLGIPSGPSFTRAIFDEFEVCPYCQAKFRG